ncbi:MAG: flagellin FliC [Gammaproteobacteria bacterium]|nr:flagellin FliC [Gammaproteobacteria bacterium]
MGVVINTNISSITASRILSENRSDLERAMERLASGKRINSAKDDAAGMAVAAKMRADIRSLNQAVRNTNDAISLVNTYDGAAAEIESILIRMRELAVQSKNGTYEAADRTNANYEYTALKTEIRRIAQVSAFNRTVLTTSAIASTGISFYVGADVAKSGNTINFMGATTAASAGLDFNLESTADGDLAATGAAGELKNILDATAATGASAAIGNLDTAINSLAAKRSEAGALVNRLEHTVSNLMNVSQRLQEAASGIEDADYAAESAALARGMVLAQAGTAMLAQANQAPQFILALLRS